MKNYLFAEAVKAVIVQQTIDCELPSDMNDLDIQGIFEQATKNLKTDEVYKKECAIQKLGEYVSEENVSEAYEKLVAQAEINDQIPVDNIITMWQPLEDRYTVSQLIEEIS